MQNPCAQSGRRSTSFHTRRLAIDLRPAVPSRPPQVKLFCLVISVRANGPERNSARNAVGARLSIHPSVAPIDEPFTEKWLERQVKFTFIACLRCGPEA